MDFTSLASDALIGVGAFLYSVKFFLQVIERA